MSKLNKYLNKISKNPKNIYLCKIIHYLIQSNKTQNYNLINKEIQIGGIKLDNIDSLLSFLKEVYDKTPTKTNKKYIVILYGPPASGKTIARKIGCKFLKDIFEEPLSLENIINSFIDTGIDEITYNVEVGDKTVKQLLLDNLNSIIPKNAIDKKTLIKDKINQLVSSSFNIYKKYRPDYVSELLYYFAIYFNRNLFFEISSGDDKYIGTLISTLEYYNYIPIFIYPFINDVSILFDRSIERGLVEGRFLNCGAPYGLTDKMKSCFDAYPKIKEILRNKKTYLIYQYNANMKQDSFQKIKLNDFSDLDNYILELEYKIIFDNENKIITNTKNFITKDYNIQTILKLSC